MMRLRQVRTEVYLSNKHSKEHPPQCLHVASGFTNPSSVSYITC